MLDYSFNYLDGILAIPILIFFIQGFNKGFKNEINGFIGLLTGAYLTLNFSSLLYPKLSELLVGYEILIPISSIIILFIATLIGVKVLGYILDIIFKTLSLGFLDKLLGSIIGVLKFVIVVGFVLAFTSVYELINPELRKDSVMIIPIQEVSTIIFIEVNKHTDVGSSVSLDYLSELSDEVLNKMKNKKNILEEPVNTVEIQGPKGKEIVKTAFPNFKTSTKYKKFITKGIGKKLSVSNAEMSSIIKKAHSYLGTRYRMGGVSYNGIDCSGLFYMSFNSQNISGVPRTAENFARHGITIKSISNLKKGDFVFFTKTYNTSKLVTHMGMYLGNQNFIHASSSKGVVVSNIIDSY
jgi:uncharacterized membrane protein required for colicin V production